jgi:Uma2 family endonuclease
MSEPTTPASPFDLPAMELEEWFDLAEDEPGELVDGRLEEEEMPGALHELTVTWLIYVLRSWLLGRGGFVLGSEAKFALGPSRGRKPDLSVFLPGGAAPPRRRVIRTPPDIAVEVLTDTARDLRRDRVEKRDDYAAFGVPWYWIVDPERRTLEIHELGADGRYSLAVDATGCVGAVPGCTGLVLDLPQLWAEIDRLGPDDSDESE